MEVKGRCGVKKIFFNQTAIWQFRFSYLGFNSIYKGIILILFAFLMVLIFNGADAIAQSTYYVRAGGGGTQNGSDWSNAYASIPSTLVRGATYYIADGSYGAYSFNTPTSGSTYIYIKKATPTSHGTDVGWQASYGANQAVFSSWTFGSGYWDIDGQSGGGPDNWTAGLGIKVGSSTSGNVISNNRDYRGMNYINLRHIEVTANASGNNNSRAFDIVAMNPVTMSHMYIHDIGCDVFYIASVNNLTVEYSKIARNYQSESGCHGDLIETYGPSSMTFRYNLIEDVVGSYMWGNHDGGTTSLKIYGNLIVWPNITPFFGNGIVGCLNSTPSGYVSNLEFYNNTISGAFNGGTQIGFYSLRGSNNVARNNIWHKTTGSNYSFGFDNATHSNNTFYNTSTVSGEQNLTGEPFVGRASGNYGLNAPTTAGYSLSSPFNEDMYGDIRGSDGTWDRGAIEYGGSNKPTAPTPPVGLRIIQ